MSMLLHTAPAPWTSLVDSGGRGMMAAAVFHIGSGPAGQGPEVVAHLPLTSPRILSHKLRKSELYGLSNARIRATMSVASRRGSPICYRAAIRNADCGHLSHSTCPRPHRSSN
jgi:hypothetical protein